jgi:hypothetical protein
VSNQNNEKCGVHTILSHTLTWRLEAPDVVEVHGAGGIIAHWNEAEGYVKYHDDDTQDEFNEGDYVAGYVLPSTAEAERIISELRALDGVVY